MSQPVNPVQTFIQEAADLLASIEELALEIDPQHTDAEAINRLFRAFHTIKGSGAMFGFDAVAEFTHHVETTLDLVRAGTLPFSEDLIGLILASKDHIESLLAASQGGAAPDPADGAKIIAALAAGHGGAPAAQTTQPAPAVSAPIPCTAATGAQAFRIRFRPSAGLLQGGSRPIALLDELRGLGACTVRADLSAVPPLESMQPDLCYVSWEIDIETGHDANTLRDVFIFVEDGSEISITPLPAQHADRAASAAAPAAGSAPAARESDAEAVASNAAARSATREATVRVPAARLDRLVNFVGELVMNQSRLNQIAGRLGAADLTNSVEELERLVGDMRDTVLGIRMMPIGTTFNRFKRLVRDLSAELGKEIDLVTEGAETELDKTVLDQLGDPLVHLIRNSIDHGIEPAADRASAGKPRAGTIRLSAVHTGSNVVITIADDGRGIDRAAVLAKAVQKGLVSPEARLSDAEIFNLVFLPGFSTARQVTSVSGRGVGMDVVKKQLDALRGGIQISSTPGRGTTIALTLPLTLAIIDGLLVEVDRDQFIVPMSAVLENVELTRAERSRNNRRNVVPVRGELVPYIRLRDTFTITSEAPATEKVVIARRGTDRVGLVVDRVLGSHQTVIQSLGRFYRDVAVLSGATIMGDGRVALILDVGGLVSFVETEPAPAHGTP